MKRRIRLIGPGLTIVFAVIALIAFAFSGPVPRWVMFIWPAIVIVWSLNVIGLEHVAKRNRTTIDLQAKVIRSHEELLTRILTTDSDGRETGPAADPR